MKMYNLLPWRPIRLAADTPWDLGSLLSTTAPGAYPDTYRGPAQPLQSLTMFIAPRDVAFPGEPVVIPAGIAAHSGVMQRSINSDGSKVYRLGSDGVRTGDILIPDSPSTPGLLLGPWHQGVTFGGRFFAYRAISVDPLLVWAAMSSRSGVVARRSLAMGTGSRRWTHRSALASILIPVLTVGEWAERRRQIEQLWRETATSSSPLELGRSWWRTKHLPVEQRWDLLLIRDQAGDQSAGDPLRELVVFIRTGTIRNIDLINYPRLETSPVITPEAVRRDQPPLRWVAPGREPLLAAPGDIVVTTAGLKSRAAVLDASMAVGTGLAWMRLRDPSGAHDLVRYINSRAGQAQLAQLVTGNYIPHLTLNALRTLVIPDLSQLSNDDLTGSRLPLADLLEAALWT